MSLFETLSVDMDFGGLQTDIIMQEELSRSRQRDSATRLYSTYQFLEEIGHGAYGRVTKAKHKVSRSLVAIKHIDKKKAGNKGLSEVFSEVETMSLLSHPNIVRLQETFEDQNNLWIVMDYVPGGELQTSLKEVGHFDEQTARRMTIHLLLAIDYFHDKGIVHRDLKPANCLLSQEGDQELKIADFGFAVLVGRHSFLTSFCGTTAYMAPEIIMDLPYGKPVDMWSAGVIIYQLLCGEYPFQDREGNTMQEEIISGTFSFTSPIWNDVSVGCKDLISKLLVVEQEKRLTAADALKHYWIRAGMNSECDLFDFDRSSNYDGSTSHGKVIRTGKTIFRAGVYTVIAAHRLVYSIRCIALKREGCDYPLLLKSYSYLVTRRYHPANRSINASGMCYGNMRAILHLVAMLEASDNVETFDVSNNGIDSLDVLQQVVRVSTGHPTLSVLNLENNPIPPLAGRALLRLARAATRLRVINVNNTNLGADVIGSIAQYLKESEKKRDVPSTPGNTGGLNVFSSSASTTSSTSGRHGGQSGRLTSPSTAQGTRTPSSSGGSRLPPSRATGTHLPPIHTNNASAMLRRKQ